MEKYRTCEISAVDVAVYSALCSLRRGFDGVRLSQRKIALICNIKSVKTVAASVHRLYKIGLIRNVITPVVKKMKKYETSIYQLKPLPVSGFFFVPKSVLQFTCVAPKMFAVYSFLCYSNHSEYVKSWNSYADLCVKMGFSRGQRSEVIKLIGSLAGLGLIKKTIRKIKGVYVDNIYRVCGIEGVFSDFSVGCEFTYNILLHKGMRERMRENGRTEKKIFEWWDFSGGHNIFEGGRILF
jgi:predicted transcriptional regulator